MSETERPDDEKKPLPSRMERLFEDVIITAKVKCDRGCGVSYRPRPEKCYVGDLIQHDGRRVPFFTTRCRDCARILLWTEADFPDVSRELLAHDRRTRPQDS
jgi:hypothetical protein